VCRCGRRAAGPVTVGRLIVVQIPRNVLGVALAVLGVLMMTSRDRHRRSEVVRPGRQAGRGGPLGDLEADVAVGDRERVPSADVDARSG
jgi:hypothetical protein